MSAQVFRRKRLSKFPIPQAVFRNHFELQATTFVVLSVPWRCEVRSLAFMDDLERIPVRVKYIGGIVSRIVFHSCPR
jgi:hypothetical protein